LEPFKEFGVATLHKTKKKQVEKDSSIHWFSSIFAFRRNKVPHSNSLDGRGGSNSFPKFIALVCFCQRGLQGFDPVTTGLVLRSFRALLLEASLLGNCSFHWQLNKDFVT